jgi:hypothetical protein
MTYEKHTTHTDALDTLGEVIDETQKRDAIHLAVEPVTAGQRLAPGQHVKFNAEGEAVAAFGDGIGIVDPFLRVLVEVGQNFWLVVYPRQISSLRHVWEHPSFPPSGETQVTLTETPEITAKFAAEQWIRTWLKTTDISQFEFEEVMEALETGRGGSYPELVYRDGELYSYGTDAYGNIPQEFWDMAGIYRADYFSCSC